jgi:hypothetical protein
MKIIVEGYMNEIASFFESFEHGSKKNSKVRVELDFDEATKNSVNMHVTVHPPAGRVIPFKKIKRVLSAAGRKRISMAQKARWAKLRRMA